MKILIMMGSSNSGKTVHGKQLAKELGFGYIASGAVARGLMDSATQAEFAQGKLSPYDDAIREAIYNKILESQSLGGCIVDGFPRQSFHVINFIMWLETWMKQTASRAEVIVVRLNVPVPVLVARVVTRARDEFDTEAILMKRHDVYLGETVPAIEYLSYVYGKEVAVHLAGECTVENVHMTLLDELRDKGYIA